MASSAVLSRDLTELAVAIAPRLDPGHYHLSWTEDLRAKAWCFHADACRRFNQAEPALVSTQRAIKVLPAELAQSAQFKLRFQREAKTISAAQPSAHVHALRGTQVYFSQGVGGDEGGQLVMTAAPGHGLDRRG